ncbi:MAG: mevalonate kinase [Halobacteriota archaeon]
MITCSAPGKVYLFGEHAVVYGQPAIACAVEKRTFTSVKLLGSDEIAVRAMGKAQRCFSAEFRYICQAVKTVKKRTENNFGAEITVTSELPPSQGLGSSAAVTVSTIKALSECLEIGLSDLEIAGMGYQVEQAIQGRASRADTFVSTTGGVVMIEGTSTSHLTHPHIPVIIGVSGITRSTGDIISSVAQMKREYPEIIENIMLTIGDIARRGERKLIEGDVNGVGELMNMNQGLLESIGVGEIMIDKLIYWARGEGALGAKMTGAGRGGCMFAIAREDNIDAVAGAMAQEGAQVFRTAFSDVGLRIE